MPVVPRPSSVTRQRRPWPLWRGVLCVLVLAVVLPSAAGRAAMIEHRPSQPPTLADDKPSAEQHPVSGRGPRTTSSARWGWPLHPTPQVVEPFRAPVDPWAAGHRGVDLWAAADQPAVGHIVLAPADGVIAFAGKVVNRGVLTIDHADGLRSSFEPVGATLPVGTVVRRGDPVAVVTEGGHSAGSLHWGVRRGDQYLDPLRLLRPRSPPVLLPLWR